MTDMQYRSFPKVPDLRISTLGFGCMRLPTVGDAGSAIDEDLAARLLHEAIDAGVNYVDTAWPYHNGESEPFLGRALAGGWRSRVHVATKSPVWLMKTQRDWEDYLDNQLGRLGSGSIDFYLLHGLNGTRFELVRQLDGLKALERARADGRIGHIGFSFHGSIDEFKAIVDGYDWEFCQIQFNYLDEGYQAGIEGLRYAAARRLGIVVMEALRGGALAQAPPAIEPIWSGSGRFWSPAEWALRWVWNHPEVTTVLSGMNEENQVRENVRVASTPEAMSAADLERIGQARQAYHARMRVPCTTCGYCQPCPSNVAIADVLSLHNASLMFGSRKGPASVYRNWVMRSNAGADQCAKCGECETKCPQGIEIMDALEQAHAYLTLA